MHRIYSLASRILIWSSQEESEHGINSVINYLDDLQNEGLEHRNIEAATLFTHTNKLFGCEWWQRVWTIQEAAVVNFCSLVLWGAREIQWVFLIELVKI
jgi:hypothetical protein